MILNENETPYPLVHRIQIVIKLLYILNNSTSFLLEINTY